MSVEEHRKTSPKHVDCWVITVSDTRGSKEDKSGDLIVEKLETAGHCIKGRNWVKDEDEEIHKALDDVIDARAIFLTGGTGLTRRDITWKVIESYCDEPLPAFAVIFAQLSYQQVGSAAVLSRAIAGIKRSRGQLIVALPGSSRACALAVDEILIPELAHLVGHLNK
ncbi:MAG: molybdenum cofactor biosynthesis protein MoaB [Proteobacteria bacterium]|nr:molybdenum cofactor biosynthesis protein MoaB [Pseudomonadota bacterium]NOG59324.1 molybdenum cofactor biosynthesis protein MoaB [Pseudomonadota bacterium]